MSSGNTNRPGNGGRNPGRDSYGRRDVGTPGRRTRTHEYDGVVRYNERDYEDDGYDDYEDYTDFDSARSPERVRNARPVRDARPGRNDRPVRNARPARDERSGRSARPARDERPGRSARPARDERPGRSARPVMDERPGRNLRPERDALRERNVRDKRNERDKRNARRGKDEPKKSPVKTFFKRLFIIVFLITSVISVLEFVITKRAYSLMKYEEVSVGEDALTSKGVTNILLIGNDSRLGGEDGRSDAMILVSVSKKTGRILMTSILRDVYVEIPGYGSNRLNAAYSFGGPALLMETIEKNFDIHVSKYMLVNFEAFANVVDAVGGIDLELTGEEVIWVDAYLNEYNELMGREFGYDYLTQVEGGMIHLNGPQALAYSRNRYVGTDFGRTERQRKVMEQIIKKMPMAVLTNMGGLIDGLCPNLTTNMTFAEVYSLVVRAPFWLRYEREGAALPIDGSWQNENRDGMAVLGVDFEANKEYFENRLYVRDEEDDADDPEKNGDPESGEDIDK